MRRGLGTSDGITIVYEDVGPPEGAPVVLCHGLAAAAAQFAADAEFFAERGYHVLVPNLRGHGDSDPGEDYSIARMALDLVEMFVHAGVGPVHWVGNSLGGILALSLLTSEPTMFRTLATFGTSYAMSLPAWTPWFIPIGYRVLGRDVTATLTAWMTTADRESRTIIADILHEFDPDAGRAVAASIVRYDFIAQAVEATLPILMLRGGQDRAVNAGLGRTLKAMRKRPNFRLVEVPRGGHCANLDASEEVRAELMKFWDRH